MSDGVWFASESGGVGLWALSESVATVDWDFATPIDLGTVAGTLTISGDIAFSVGPAYTSGAVLYVPVRMASGLWSTTGVAASSDLSNLQAWLPPQRQPVAYQQGAQWFCDPAWYRFFQFVSEVKLGGRSGPTLPDVVTSITTTQTTAAAASASVTTLQQQTTANAEALAATVQVAQDNALTGASQIPEVRL